MAVASSSIAEQSSTVHDNTFYFDDDPMAVFLVENRLFKVHHYFFIQGSEFFRDLFSQAGGNGDTGTTEGKSQADDQPIPLPDVTVVEFQTLLRFFYAMTQTITDRATGVELLKLKFDEQLALLSISHRFMFDNIFNYLVRIIPSHQLDVWERIRLGDKYKLTEWLLSAYMHLLERPSEQLTLDAKECLGPDRVVKLLEAQVFLLQERLNNKSCNSCGYPSRGVTRSMTSARDIALRYFTTPLEPMSNPR